jgi:hypothetical protein
MSSSGGSTVIVAAVVSPLTFSGGVAMSSGAGVPAIAGVVGDLFWRTNGAVGSTLYRCTTGGGAGVAVWTAIL